MRLPIKIALSFALACSAVTALPSGAAAAPTKSAPVPTTGRTTVLTVAEGRQLWAAGPSGYWVPRPAELRRLEKDLPASLRSYYRQYFGITQSGKRLILINGFSADVAPQYTGGKYDWHFTPVQVMDGGTGYFQATYNPKTRQFIGPEFNGQG